MRGRKILNKLDLLKLAELQDCESYDESEFEEQVTKKDNFKKEYEDFYDDVKQSNKYIKEDW